MKKRYADVKPRDIKRTYLSIKKETDQAAWLKRLAKQVATCRTQEEKGKRTFPEHMSQWWGYPPRGKGPSAVDLYESGGKEGESTERSPNEHRKEDQRRKKKSSHGISDRRPNDVYGEEKNSQGPQEKTGVVLVGGNLTKCTYAALKRLGVV